MEQIYSVYIITNKKRGVLYTGMSSQLLERTWQHKTKSLPGFTSKYNCHVLVWFENHNDVEQAIYRERSIKKWKREWKIKLIERTNPHWNDLYGSLMG